MALAVVWVPVTGIWVRQSRPGVGPMQLAAFDSRWQRAGTPAAYFADSEPTAWAELYRGAAERGLAPGALFPRELHKVEVDLTHVADLSTEKARKALGLPRIRQTQAQWPVFQDVGEQLAAAGAEAILYGGPDARGEGVRSPVEPIKEAGQTARRGLEGRTAIR